MFENLKNKARKFMLNYQEALGETAEGFQVVMGADGQVKFIDPKTGAFVIA